MFTTLFLISFALLSIEAIIHYNTGKRSRGSRDSWLPDLSETYRITATVLFFSAAIHFLSLSIHFNARK
jgi:hypothetical protein